MTDLEIKAIQRWSTAQVPQASRVEFYAAALSEAIIPLAIENADPLTFNADVSVAQMDAIRVCKVIASPYGALRGPREFARTREHQFNLMMTLDCPWTANHRGKSRMMPGDILVHDSRYPLTLDLRGASVGINVAVTESWLRRWIPNPGVLVGRRIPGSSPWGSALSSYLAEMSPELIAAPPLPLSILADQIGSLLALTISTQSGAVTPEYTPALRSLRDRILDCIIQRCTECELTALHVAHAVNISVRTLHRTLAAAGETFGARLIEARVCAAERMLTSPLFNRVTTREIGLRAGFQSASHFARAVRKQTGRTPMQLRRAGHVSEG